MNGYDKTKAELVAQGFTVTRLRPDKVARDVAKRTSPKQNTFDALGQPLDRSSTKGLVLVDRSRRSNAEEEYLNALHEVFSAALERLTPQHRLYLRGVMEGKSVRQHADELDVTHPAVVQGRKRALEALAKALGARGLDDRAGIRRGLVRGTNFNLSEWLPGFTEVTA